MLSKKPKTLAVSPALAVVSWDSFKRDLANKMPRIEKGIEKEVRKILPTPNQKGREINTLVNPKIRLKIPLKEEISLIFVSSCPKVLFIQYTAFQINIFGRVKANSSSFLILFPILTPIFQS